MPISVLFIEIFMTCMLRTTASYWLIGPKGRGCISGVPTGGPMYSGGVVSVSLSPVCCSKLMPISFLALLFFSVGVLLSSTVGKDVGIEMNYTLDKWDQDWHANTVVPCAYHAFDLARRTFGL